MGDQDSDDEGGPGGLAARESLVEYARRRRDGRAATEKARAHRRQEQRSAGLGGAVARAWQARRGLGKVAIDVLGSSLHQRHHEGSHGHGHGSEVEVDEDEALRRLRLRLVRHHKSHRSASDLLEVRVAGPPRLLVCMLLPAHLLTYCQKRFQVQRRAESTKALFARKPKGSLSSRKGSFKQKAPEKKRRNSFPSLDVRDTPSHPTTA